MWAVNFQMNKAIHFASHTSMGMEESNRKIGKHCTSLVVGISFLLVTTFSISASEVGVADREIFISLLLGNNSEQREALKTIEKRWHPGNSIMLLEIYDG